MLDEVVPRNAPPTPPLSSPVPLHPSLRALPLPPPLPLLSLHFSSGRCRFLGRVGSGDAAAEGGFDALPAPLTIDLALRSSSPSSASLSSESESRRAGGVSGMDGGAVCGEVGATS